MKKLIKSKLFLQVIVASMVATLATVGIVAATTSTIGQNITTTGNLTVTGASSIDMLKVNVTTNRVGIGTTTPFATLSVNNVAGENAFVIGSSTGTWLKVDASGLLTVAKGATFASTLDATGVTTLASTLTVTGATTLSNTLGVSGIFNVNGLATTTAASGNFATRGNIMASSTLLVDGIATLAKASSTLASTTLANFGSGTTISGLLFGTCAVDPQSIAMATSSAVSTSCAASGVTNAYTVFVTPPYTVGNNWLIFEGATASTTAGYIEITLFNASTTLAIDGPSATWKWFAIK